MGGDMGGKESFLVGWDSHATADIDDSVEQILTNSDQRLGALISRIVDLTGHRRLKPSNAESHFDALARSIVNQQLSKKAAAIIYGRYIKLFGGSPSPEQVLSVEPELFRQVGLSSSKAKYLKALASAVLSGSLNLTQINDHPDDSVIGQLTEVLGIGVWTAQMFLMFRLRRPDVLPLNDVGIHRGLQLAYGLKRPATPIYVERVGRRWAPYRSIACLYLWAAVDTGFVASE